VSDQHYSAYLRRLSWRFGRRVYRSARGEPLNNSIETNGETYVQSAVIAATTDEDVLAILDVGANEGDWIKPLLSALPASRLSPDRLQLCAFEPIPETRTRLSKTLGSLRGGEVARIETCALSDTIGSMQMAVLSETGGTNTLSFDQTQAREALRLIDVETQTLAAFAEGHSLSHLHLVKCDTEGHDLRVLRGARPLLEAGRIDVLQFEYNHRWVYARAFLKDVFDLIEGLPYAVARIRRNGIEVLDAWHPELERFFEANYVLIRRPALDWFRTRRGSFDASNTYA
jgi:FkbM family methyltransferase